MPFDGPKPLARSYYRAPVDGFLATSTETVLGSLTANSEADIRPDQVNAWIEEIRLLRHSLHRVSGTLFLEFNIPRMGRRIDAVLVSGALVLVIEFKVGERSFPRTGIDQVWDYALDLKNFHQASHSATILPILVATAASASQSELPARDDDLVYRPALVNGRDLKSYLALAIRQISGTAVNPEAWGAAPYLPTPTIIEAAQSLYAKHSVDAIARHDAGASNLRVTSKRIEDIVDASRSEGKKAICFVTGVPGAGKTLVGLNIATRRSDIGKPTHAVFLSGNGPLVAVLREALTRDEVKRRRDAGERCFKSHIHESVKAFIQNVHHFRDEGLRDSRPPADHVVIFDEAQRAWNREKTELFMRTKKKRTNFNQSEPSFLISYLDRHSDWAVVVCLVGGGQEINTGEAGIGAWLDAIEAGFPHWHVYISRKLTDSEYAAGRAVESVQKRPLVTFDSDLHLAVSMRSFRAENVSTFVKAVLDCETAVARDAFQKLRQRYPIALTRDLERARRWIKQHARGSERYGLVASSEAQRLKPHAIDVRVDVDPVQWFLNDRSDTRSSYYLEDAATEFQVQGLELDWVCVTWDGDFRFADGAWAYHSFWGNGWRHIHKAERQVYLRNAYRVLLTRARQGMVIFVPRGEPDDPTRHASIYDTTFHYLEGIGIPVIDL